MCNVWCVMTNHFTSHTLHLKGALRRPQTSYLVPHIPTSNNVLLPLVDSFYSAGPEKIGTPDGGILLVA